MPWCDDIHFRWILSLENVCTFLAFWLLELFCFQESSRFDGRAVTLASRSAFVLMTDGSDVETLLLALICLLVVILTVWRAKKFPLL
ncbi:hypothetical protein VIBC2010_19915 [Vibrio caribbeanicus ATCC BAA-2122]|uniref:Uncharacterized protein n=1 Tax=Vibrio caribbeanicus ATCC BAA-2122 TaxID=796620 RepID=E3BIZ3_9VIBR|nr:hypothetical protein VIBC2010_19915 [Vibrio caribbeanicus ATCC BAA-2122]